MAENHHPRLRRATWNRGFSQSVWFGPAILLIITVLFFWKLVLSNQYTWMEGGDVSRQVLPWFQFQVGEWQKGRFPLWDPYSWGGQPLIGQAHPHRHAEDVRVEPLGAVEVGDVHAEVIEPPDV